MTGDRHPIFDDTPSPEPSPSPQRSWTPLLLAGALLVVAVSIAGFFTLTRFGIGDSSDAPVATDSDTTDTEAPDTTVDDTDEGAPPVGGDGVLTYGGLLPQSGDLEFLGPPMEAGVELAIADINEAGGVFGSPVQWRAGDSAADPAVASATVDEHLAANVDAIIGAATSRVTGEVIGQITGGGAIEVSPSTTSPNLIAIEDRGRFFRTAPSDVLQGRALAELMRADGAATTALLVIDDPYGTDLAATVTARYQEIGGTVTSTEVYEFGTSDFDARVTAAAAGDPDAIVIIGFDETASILDSLVANGVGPTDKLIYGVDANMGNYLGAQVADPASIAGMRGTLPGLDIPETAPDLVARLETTPSGRFIDDFLYSAESYDAVVMVALAAIAAGVDDPDAIAAQIPEVTDSGTACTSFADCVDLLASGTDIDYDGASGPLEINGDGEPDRASVRILEFDATGSVFVAATVLGSLS